MSQAEAAYFRIITGGSCYKYHFCCDKHLFVMTEHVFCRDKGMPLASTTLLSQQNYVCRDKIFCRGKPLVVANLMTNILLSQEKMCFVAKNTFVVTKVSLW